MRKTRSVNTSEFIGEVYKLGSQMQNKWAQYSLEFTEKNGAHIRYGCLITKLHRIWINDEDQYYTNSLNSQINHILNKYSRKAV